MGLTIHYELRLPGETSDTAAVHYLQRLHNHAVTLGPKGICPVLTFSGAELSAPDDTWEGGTVEWLVHIFTDVMRKYRDGVVEDIADGDRLAAAAFVVYPGEGTESATFGLVRPLLTEAPTNLEDDDNAAWRHWYWQTFCKTQYASAVSEVHFVSCHRMVIDLLDEARRIGFEVTVHDEGQYWETRDAEVLLTEVRNANRIIAHFAGALHDAISPEHSVQAEIFAHPEFEHLEMERIERNGDDYSSDV
ncbi:MAG: hypothetical protein ABI664_05615 [bacterium]